MDTAVLEFEEFPDHEIVVRLNVPLREYEAMLEAWVAASTMHPARLRELAERFAPYLVRWTFPEPVGLDGLLEREPVLIFAIVRGWVRGVRDVPLPLPRRSSDGDTSEDPTTSPPASPTPDSSTP